MDDVIVIGGGAAGLMCAAGLAGRGLAVTVLEPNMRTGRKLRITGKGRCNVTNACEPREFLDGVMRNPKFLKSALYAFPPSATTAFFESLGVPLKTERGNRVFPVSDRADDVADALERWAREGGVRFLCRRALAVAQNQAGVTGVETAEGLLPCRAAVLCTGGLSYPATGSTGDGYRIAAALGHRIVPPRASLVPLEGEEVCRQLQGLSLRNVTLSVYRGERLLFRELGELLFTHFGLSGPLTLSASACLGGDASGCRGEVDLKPGLTAEKLDERILRDFGRNKNRYFRNALDDLLPQKLIPVVVSRSGIPGETPVNGITRTQRRCLGEAIKRFSVAITGLRPLEEAIITAGGVDVGQVDPRTMASRLVPVLYFAGEILDLDACTGGYNLQIAWSTANAAVRSIVSEG